MRLLFASETHVPDVNGAAYFVARLGSELSARGHEVHLVCPRAAHPRDAGSPAPVVHELPSLALPLYPGLRVARPDGLRSHVRRLLDEIAPDVVHVQNHFVVGRYVLREARRAGLAVVATNHFLPENIVVHVPAPASLGGLLTRLLWRDLRSVYQAASLVTAPTPFAAAVTAKHCCRTVLSVSCGVDTTVFAPEVGCARFRARYELRQGPTLLSVGRLDPEKHVDEVIRAFALVRRHVDAQLVVVGQGKQLDELRGLAVREGVAEHVRFVGYVPDDLLPSAYAAADVYCHAGTAELQSISTMEAMASGKAVVAADAQALPLLVTDRVNGYLYPSGDVRALAERLRVLLTDGECRARMGEASRRAVTRHSLQRTVDAFEALYERARSEYSVSLRPRRAPSAAGRRPPHPSSLAEAGVLATLTFALPIALLISGSLSPEDLRVTVGLTVGASAIRLARLPPSALRRIREPILRLAPPAARLRIGALLAAALVAVVVTALVAVNAWI